MLVSESRNEKAMPYGVLVPMAAPGLLALPAQVQLTVCVPFHRTAGQLTLSECDNIALHVREAGYYWYRKLGMTAPRSFP